MYDPNLKYLEREWLVGKPAEAALKNFKRWKSKTLARILRHHDDGKKITDWETWRRDEFDFLLGFYSVIEIAMMIGFVSELPTAFRRKHLAVLSNSAIRRYYEWNYPIDPPRRLRERMQSNLNWRVSASVILDASFYEFLDLTRIIERDEDLESFLWALDGGWRKDEGGECDIDEVRKRLRSQRRLAKALQQQGRSRNELDAALIGFCKFIQFCEGLDELIERLKGQNQPAVAEAMWLTHAYWFRQFESHLGQDLTKAIRALTKWSAKGANLKTLRKRVKGLDQMVRRLASPPMADWNMSGKTGAGQASPG